MKYNLFQLREMFPGDWDHDSAIDQSYLDALSIEEFLPKYSSARKGEVYWLSIVDDDNQVVFELTYDPETIMNSNEWSGFIGENSGRVKLKNLEAAKRFYKKYWALENFK